MAAEPDPAAPGLDRLRADMARRRADALATLADTGPAASRIAAAVAEHGRVRLLGMGASHGANRTAAVVLRRRGLDAIALTAADALGAPLPPRLPRVYASQSGESGEIRELLANEPDAPAFGITLTPASPLARTVPTLVGAGGPEHGFAATRSVLVTLAAWARIARELGDTTEAAETALNAPASGDLAALVPRLRSARAVAFVAHGTLTGLAEVLALNVIELARVPALAMEAGTFRHGPLELLGPALAVVMLRAAEPGHASLPPLADLAARAGSPTIVVDAAGAGDAPADLTLAPHAGFAAAFALAPPLQDLVVRFAEATVDDVGEPRHARKVTTEV